MAKNKEGINSLHLAAYYDNVEIASYLASEEIPFDLNAVTLNGYTPLCVAIVKENQDVAKILL
jgi:ankyrin repeat protein